MIRFVFALTLATASLLQAYEYPEAVVNSYVANCSQGTPRSTCRCVIGKLQEEIPYEDFLALSNRIATGSFSRQDVQTVQSASDECGGDFSGNQVESQPSSPRTTPEFESRKADLCQKMAKNAKECWEREERMPDNSSKIIRQNICGQMDMQYTTYCLH